MLDVERMVTEAAEEADGDDFGPPTWREGLEILVTSAAEEAALEPSGEALLKALVLRNLTNRVGVLGWHRRHPEIRSQPVQPTLFILGLPHPATAWLADLLDGDPANRSLLRAESGTSTPPPHADELRTSARVRAAQEELEKVHRFQPELGAVHPEDAAGPTECARVLSQDFRSLHFETLAHVPSYGLWAQACRMDSAYRWHRAVLQVLQVRAPGRWVLRSPSHSLALDALVAEYPDARFVALHHDPAEAVAAACEAVRLQAGAGSRACRDTYIGARWLDVCGRMVDGMQAGRAVHGEKRFFDLDTQALVADPLGNLARLYDWLGWPLTAGAEAGFRHHLDGPRQLRRYKGDGARRPRRGWSSRSREGHQGIDLGRYGLSAEEVRARMPDYCVRYGYV